MKTIKLMSVLLFFALIACEKIEEPVIEYKEYQLDVVIQNLASLELQNPLGFSYSIPDNGHPKVIHSEHAGISRKVYWNNQQDLNISAWTNNNCNIRIEVYLEDSLWISVVGYKSAEINYIN